MATIYNSSRSSLNLKFQCPHCPASFSKRNFLQKHLDGEHKDLRFSCLTCPKTYASKGGVKKHAEKCVPLPVNDDRVMELVREVVDEVRASARAEAEWVQGVVSEVVESLRAGVGVEVGVGR